MITRGATEKDAQEETEVKRKNKGLRGVLCEEEKDDTGKKCGKGNGVEDVEGTIPHWSYHADKREKTGDT